MLETLGPAPRRVLIFSTTPLSHFEIELDLFRFHKERGDAVRVAACGGFLVTCWANPNGETDICVTCRSRSRDGLSLIGATKRERGWMDHAPSNVPQIPQFATLAELRAFTYQDAPLGRGAVSTLVSLNKDSAPNMALHSGLVQSLVASAIRAFEAASLEIDEFRPDLAYIFNGRLATQVPLVSACITKNVRYLTHDRGGELGWYRLVDAPSVHSIEHAKRAIDHAWESSADTPVDRASRGEQFFTSRRHGIGRDIPARLDFTKGQIKGLLPIGLDIADCVVIFNSSEDEFVALDEYQNPIYLDQMMALDEILSDQRLLDIQFVLRVHPNLAERDNTQTKHIESLAKYSNLTIIDSDDPVDTYALMESCRMVLTFGSTTGIEAVYWGTPSVLVGRAPYEDLGCIVPAFHEDLVEVLLGPTPPRPDRQSALKYGLYAGGGNARLRFVEQLEWGRALVGHRELRVTRRAEWLARFIRFLRRLRRGEESRWGIVLGAGARLPASIVREFRR